MNAPTSSTRFIGTPRMANVLYLLSGLAVFGWFGGVVPWWLVLMAFCFTGTVRKAVQDVRRYDAWAADWRAMEGPGTASPRPPARASFRMRQKNAPPWVSVTIAALSLLVIPVVMGAPGTDAALRQLLTLLWLGSALYLVWKLAARLRRSVVRSAGAASAGRSKGTSPDVVEWALPRASSSSSRADAVRRLPEYSARLLQ